MGSFISAHKMFCGNSSNIGNSDNTNKIKICYECSKKIEEGSFIICVRCKILLHDKCEEIFRNNQTYTTCPRCDRCGSLGTVQDMPVSTF